MSCDCHIEASDESQRRTLMTLLAINGAMFVIELTAGIMGQSSGVLADSLDMLADALVYGVGLYAIGKQAAVKQRAAWWAGIVQLVLAASIVIDVLRRALWGSEPQSSLMIAIASVALAANAYCFFLLHKHREGEVHMRASWLFTRTDVIANAGVILAGVLVAWLQSRWPDIVVGAAISAVVIHGGWSILREAKRDACAAAVEPQ